MKRKERILVVAAHPDDEVLGCGGTMAKMAQDGAEVHILILGEGITSRQAIRIKKATKKQLVELKNHIKTAAKIIGAKQTYVYDFPDNRFDTVALLDIIKVIERVKAEVGPEVIYTHYQGDLNVDHRRVFNAVLTACRPLASESVKEIYSFEVPSSTEWSAAEPFRPSVYVDIEDTLEQKIAALRAYRGEIRAWPHPRSAEAIRIFAQKRGCEAGLNMAEAFQLVRKIK